jgi:hypothetical protein
MLQADTLLPPRPRAADLERGATAVMEELWELSALEAPDLIGPVTAFRSWRVVDGRLRSPYQPVFWDERTLDARCEPLQRSSGDLHRAPYPGCRCGIHACLEPDLDFPKVDYRGVVGAVTVWGRIEVSRGGLRAEHARIEALALYSRSSSRLKSALWRIAETLDVDLVGLDDLETAAADYGSPLPAALLQ